MSCHVASGCQLIKQQVATCSVYNHSAVCSSLTSQCSAVPCTDLSYRIVSGCGSSCVLYYCFVVLKLKLIMKRNRQQPSGSQKRQALKKRNLEAAKSSKNLSVWLDGGNNSTRNDGNNDGPEKTTSQTLEDILDGNEDKVNSLSNIETSRDLSRDTSNKGGLKLYNDKTSNQQICPFEEDVIVIDPANDKSSCLKDEDSADCDAFPTIVDNEDMKRRLVAAGPIQPDGPFPKDVNQHGRSFSRNYYSTNTKSGLKLKRSWLCYSQKLDCVYCLPCWLFQQSQSESTESSNRVFPFSTVGVRDWKHISERISVHEASRCHTNSCVVYEQWRKHGTLEEIFVKNLADERSFWRKVLERILNVTLTLATCNLAFRGSSEKLEHSNKGNFLSIVQLLSKYDPVLQKLLQRPQGAVTYLSPQIQNEVIDLLANQIKQEIITELQSALFFSLILDTTQDVGKVDQLSEVYRYVKIVNDDGGKPIDMKICETFVSFREVRDQSAQGLAEEIISSLEEKNLDLTKCRGQGYDGAAVMSGAYSGVQQRIKEKAPHAYFVHCAAHNLNLVLKDAVEGNRVVCQFFETIQSVYCFFGHSIVRWQVLQSVYETEAQTDPTDSLKRLKLNSKVTLKTLNPTRWSGRHDAVYALKHRFCDVMKSLARITLTSTKSKERNEAQQLKNKLESFDFVLLLVVQCKVLESLNIVSKSLQSETMDLLSAYELLSSSLLRMTEIRGQFEEFVSEASAICCAWGINKEFQQNRIKTTKKHFDELCEDERLVDPKSCFRVTVFYPMVDTICSQLDHRFQGMQAVLKTYQVIQPDFLRSASESDVHRKAAEFVATFPNDVSSDFPSQLCSVKNSFQNKLAKMKGVKEFAHFLIVDHSSLTSSYPDVCTACIMYLTVPVTVSKAEQSFSKLKLIKNYLRSTMAQERLTSLALLSIENDRAQEINFDNLIDEFASLKVRKQVF